MAEYHVGCGIAGIYAGTVKRNGAEWKDKTEVTDEALLAVANYIIMEARARHENEAEYHGFTWPTKNGRVLHLKAKITEEKDGQIH